MNSNIKFFVGVALVLGVLVIGVEIGSVFLGLNKNEDTAAQDQIIPLPGSFNQDLIKRLKDKEKYLLLTKEQFSGNASGAPITTPTPTATPTSTTTVKPTTSATPKVTGTTTPSPSTTNTVTPTPSN